MHLIYKNWPNTIHTQTFMKILIITLMCIDSTLMSSITGQFSIAYIDLIKYARNTNKWWKTCPSALQEQQIFLSKIYSPNSIHTNTQQNKSNQDNQTSIKQKIDQTQQFSYLQIAKIIMEEMYKVLMIETWQEIKKSTIASEQNTRPVQYDDNFASLNGGAIILRKSSNRIHNAQSILQDNSQKYLYSDEKLPLELIIALKQEVKIERISIKSNQIYSSIVRSFILQGALNQNQQQEQFEQSKVWFKILSTQAKNSGEQQQFRTRIKAVKFLRLRIISKYGDWKYFTMTQLKIYGSGLFTQALVDYQSIKNSIPQVKMNQTQIQQTKELNFAYKGLDTFRHEEQEQKEEKKQDQNLLTFLLKKVNKLSRNNQFHLLYMRNVSQRWENVTKLEKQFRQHKNQYDAKNNFEEKYKPNRKLQLKIQSIQQRMQTIQKSLINLNTFMQQFKYNNQMQNQECPSKQEQAKQFVIYVAISTIFFNIVISVLVVYCFLKFNKPKQLKEVKEDVKIQQTNHP